MINHTLRIAGLIVMLIMGSCTQIGTQTSSSQGTGAGSIKQDIQKMPFMWENATLYFLLIDRFNNGDSTNDFAYDRKRDGAVLRNFMGGDIVGITQKIQEGYFDKLGVNALWFTPPVEQIRGFTDEGTGKTYAYHGYWARDWTALDPNFGTEEEFKQMVEVAHAHGIRLVWDAVLNHTGPVTPTDSQWPDNWVRTSPACTYQDFETTVSCTLVENLPDLRTEEENAVELPDFLVKKWQNEGRLEKEMAELEAFFARTGYPRAPKYYMIKWLTDWIRKYGIDAFRIDTAKHTEAAVWEDLKKEAVAALREWKTQYPAQKPDDLDFFMTGEVYGYQIHNSTAYSYGDTSVNFFEHGFESLINFAFTSDAQQSYETLFGKYSELLNQGALADYTVVNYLSSHDDGNPFDKQREKVFEAGTKLLLTPGIAQIYYGDETARKLTVQGAEGDANLRSFMNWEAIAETSTTDNPQTSEVLAHWQRLGQFRRAHPAVGAGIHQLVSEKPYVFSRILANKDTVLVALDLPQSQHTLSVNDLFADGTMLKEYYSDQTVAVQKGEVVVNTPHDIMLLGKPR